MFYRVAIQGTFLTQKVQNTLYFGAPLPDLDDWDRDVAVNLGNSVLDAWDEVMLPRLPTGYALVGARVDGVDNDNNPLPASPMLVERAGVGNVNTPSDTGAIVLVAAFQMGQAALAVTRNVPRRSYLAVGPLTSDQVSDSGALVARPAWQLAMEALGTQGHLIGVVEYSPFRLGTPAPTGEGRVGTVEGIVVRPYASFRRSRLVRPMGT